MAAAAVIALFVPSAVAGDPPPRSHAPHLAEGRDLPDGVPDGRGGHAGARWAAVPGAPAVREAADPPRREPPSAASFAARPGGEVLPVLPLGAGLASLGLGLGILGLRLRRAS